MNDDPAFYRARAEEEQKNADSATLDNVRDRCRRAQLAWKRWLTAPRAPAPSAWSAKPTPPPAGSKPRK